jgi:hypothetical protein
MELQNMEHLQLIVHMELIKNISTSNLCFDINLLLDNINYEIGIEILESKVMIYS